MFVIVENEVLKGALLISVHTSIVLPFLAFSIMPRIPWCHLVYQSQNRPILQFIAEALPYVFG